MTGIAGPTIGKNRKRQRPNSPLEYSRTQDGITFAAVEAVLENLEPDVQVKKEATSKDPVKRARKQARSKLEEDIRGDAPPPQKLRKSSSGRTIKPTTR